MPLKSMTGFGWSGGQENGAAWNWELRSVNGRGLDMRFRLPGGFEEFELQLRQRLAKALGRGNCAIALGLKMPAATGDIRLNEALLLRFAELAERARALTGRIEPVGLETILTGKGVIEVGENQADEDGKAALQAALLAGFESALAALIEARAAEGSRLEAVIAEKVNEIEQLTVEAEQSPARTSEAIGERLRTQLRRLFGEQSELDPDRLHQEAMLLAARADIEEEIKRLKAHVAAARDLMAASEPVGRKFEFLAQEFQREANTLCSKSNATEITRIGLRLKSAIDQFREQVQNVE